MLFTNNQDAIQHAQYNSYMFYISAAHTHKVNGYILRGSRGGGVGGFGPSLKNHENIGVISNTGPDPLKNHKATEPESNVRPSSARQRAAI